MSSNYTFINGKYTPYMLLPRPTFNHYYEPFTSTCMYTGSNYCGTDFGKLFIRILVPILYIYFTNYNKPLMPYFCIVLGKKIVSTHIDQKRIIMYLFREYKLCSKYLLSWSDLFIVIDYLINHYRSLAFQTRFVLSGKKIIILHQALYARLLYAPSSNKYPRLTVIHWLQ